MSSQKQREYSQKYYEKHKQEEQRKQREYYWQHREERLAYAKTYQPKDLEKFREYHERYNREYRLKHNEELREQYRRYYAENKEKAYAKKIAERYVPLDSHCEICGATHNLLRHHPDYSKPLDIITVCRSCHNRIHRGNLKIQELTKEK